MDKAEETPPKQKAEDPAKQQLFEEQGSTDEPSAHQTSSGQSSSADSGIGYQGSQSDKSSRSGDTVTSTGSLDSKMKERNNQGKKEQEKDKDTMSIPPDYKIGEDEEKMLSFQGKVAGKIVSLDFHEEDLSQIERYVEGMKMKRRLERSSSRAGLNPPLSKSRSASKGSSNMSGISEYGASAMSIGSSYSGSQSIVPMPPVTPKLDLSKPPPPLTSRPAALSMTQVLTPRSGVVSMPPPTGATPRSGIPSMPPPAAQSTQQSHIGGHVLMPTQMQHQPTQHTAKPHIPPGTIIQETTTTRVISQPMPQITHYPMVPQQMPPQMAAAQHTSTVATSPQSARGATAQEQRRQQMEDKKSEEEDEKMLQDIWKVSRNIWKKDPDTGCILKEKKKKNTKRRHMCFCFIC